MSKGIDRFKDAFGERFSVTVEIVGTHCSKSIDLPVVKASTGAGSFTLRDNFHDCNLMAILRRPAALTVDQLFAGIQEPLTWEWYLAEIDRARRYSWREWTDEEIRDPRILRVQTEQGDKRTWREKTGDEKDRWLARMSNPAWYRHDWAGHELAYDGNFRPGVRLYRQAYAYGEGIDVTTSNRRYAKGIRDFIIATDTLASAVLMIERLSAEVA